MFRLCPTHCRKWLGFLQVLHVLQQPITVKRIVLAICELLYIYIYIYTPACFSPVLFFVSQLDASWGWWAGKCCYSGRLFCFVWYKIPFLVDYRHQADQTFSSSSFHFLLQSKQYFHIIFSILSQPVTTAITSSSISLSLLLVA